MVYVNKTEWCQYVNTLQMSTHPSVLQWPLCTLLPHTSKLHALMLHDNTISQSPVAPLLDYNFLKVLKWN